MIGFKEAIQRLWNRKSNNIMGLRMLRMTLQFKDMYVPNFYDYNNQISSIMCTSILFLVGLGYIHSKEWL